MSVAVPIIDSIDGVTRRIFLKQGVSDYFPIEDLYHEYRNRRRLDTDGIRKYNPLLKAEGNIPKGGGAFTPRYVVLLEGCKVVPYDEALQISQLGDMITDDPDTDPLLYDISGLTTAKPIFITPSESETIQLNTAEIEFSTFNNRVTLDPINGQPGTESPIGNQKNPSNNLTDALAIANFNGFKEIRLRGFVTANATHNLDGFLIQGGSGSSNVIILAGATTESSDFNKLIVVGLFKGLSRIRDCILGTTGLGGVTGVEGRVLNSIINHPDGVAQNPTGAGTLFDNCSFIAPNDPQIVIDANGVGFGLRLCTGNIKITNFMINEAEQINILGARVELANTCTAGTFTIEGNGSVVDNSNGTEVILNLNTSSGELGNGGVWTEEEKDTALADINTAKRQAEISALNTQKST